MKKIDLQVELGKSYEMLHDMLRVYKELVDLLSISKLEKRSLKNQIDQEFESWYDYNGCFQSPDTCLKNIRREQKSNDDRIEKMKETDPESYARIMEYRKENQDDCVDEVD